jgi:hypothetical protein
MMQPNKSRFVLAVGLALAIFGAAECRASRVENPLFGYTHLLASPFTLPAGRVSFGTEVAVGVTDFLQIGTNLVSDAYQVYNAYAKLSLLDFPAFAMGLTLGYQTFNYNNLNASNPDLQVTSWLPGVVTSYALHKNLAVFVGANANLSKQTLLSEGVQVSGYFQGATVESDLSWAYNPHKDRVGNVLSGGVSYNLSYQLIGVGLSHHWRGFHIGLHYYPNADENRILPIIAGGTSVDL